MVRRTAALEGHLEMRLVERGREVLGRTRPDVVTRAAAFLLLQDSRSSFQIEGEQPSPTRAAPPALPSSGRTAGSCRP